MSVRTALLLKKMSAAWSDFLGVGGLSLSLGVGLLLWSPVFVPKVLPLIDPFVLLVWDPAFVPPALLLVDLFELLA